MYRSYLEGVGRNSLPNYQAIRPNAPNFHRVNDSDPRAYVKGCFHQFAFYPWNQDILGLFARFRDVYCLKNRLSDVEEERFLGPQPDDECIARIAFQFYPSGKGFLNRHRDPVSYHQLVVPVVIVSEKGRDFQEGGLFVENDLGDRVCVDDITKPGDVVFFNASQVHGVAPIDPTESLPWTDFSGRWMILIAVNRLEDNASVGDSQDIDEA